MSEMNTCKNCGKQFTGKYCNNCGEKVYTDHDKTIQHIAHEGLHFITHFEGTLLNTGKAVFTKPGKLTAEYCNGIRKKYFKPLSFFLIVIILYLLFPMFRGLNMTFSTYVNEKYKYSWFAAPIAKKKMDSLGITEIELQQKYDSSSEKFAKPLLLILLPFSALLIWLLNIKKRRLFFDHFIMATELNTFMVAFGYLLLPIVAYIALWISPRSITIFSDDSLMWPTVWLLYLVVIAVAFRRFYQDKWWVAYLKAIVFLAVYLFVIQQLYKFILYFLIMLFIHK